MVPIGGVALAFVGLALWVSAIPWRALDPIVGGLFVVGLGLSIAGYLRSPAVTTRRIGVVGIGANGVGLILLLLLWSAG